MTTARLPARLPVPRARVPAAWVLSTGPPHRVARPLRALAAGRHTSRRRGRRRRPRRRPAVVLEVPRARLTMWNLALALFHGGLAALTLAVGNVDLAVPVYKTVLDFRVLNATDANGTSAPTDAWELVPSYARSGSLPFTVLTAAFFLLSATFHLLNATLLRGVYLRELARCCTPTRWVEYFLSAPIMMVLIAYMLGVRDRASLLAVAALVAATMPYGYWVEQLGRPASPEAWTRSLAYRLTPWAVGHVPQLAAWAIVLLQFYDGTADPADVTPAFVHVILWAQLVLFFSFGAASLLAQAAAPRLFYRGEVLFQVLSLVSKGLLGGLLLANVLMLSSFEELY